MDRRLAAILAVDVVGYSRRMGEDEPGTLAALRECRAQLFDLVTSHAGQIINTAGDSVLAHLPSVVSAVECGRAFQRFLEERNEHRSPATSMEFRLGIHQGELVVDGDDVYGDGINVAVRPEGFARPGGIAVSARIHEDVLGKIEMPWEDAGEQQLENIVRPVRVWLSGGRPKGNDRPPPNLPDRPSVAVLPFASSTIEDPDSTFGDGVAEDIINGLARFRSVFVVARSSSFHFKGNSSSLSDVAAALGVAYIVEGSVRRGSTKVRVNVRLVEAASATTVWAERYDRALADIFEVQDDVSTRIVGTLVGRIEETRAEMSLRKPPSDLAAYDLMLQGLGAFRGYGLNSNQRAATLFQQSIERDPGYGLSHCYLALARLALGGYGAASVKDRAEAVALVMRGLELAPQDATCQRLAGHVLLYNREYDRAEYHSRRAIELNPNDADGTISMGYLLVQRGQASDAIQWMEKAVRLNPFHPPWYHAQIASAFYSLRRYGDCIRATHRLPEIGGWSFRLAAAYAQIGRVKDANREAEKILEHDPTFAVDAFIAGTILLEREADREILRDGLLKAGLPR